MTNPLATAPLYRTATTDNMVEGHVYKHSKGFIAVLHDVDAGESLPTGFIFADFTKAVAKADSFVAGDIS